MNYNGNTLSTVICMSQPKITRLSGTYSIYSLTQWSEHLGYKKLHKLYHNYKNKIVKTTNLVVNTIARI